MISGINGISSAYGYYNVTKQAAKKVENEATPDVPIPPPLYAKDVPIPPPLFLNGTETASQAPVKEYDVPIPPPLF